MFKLAYHQVRLFYVTWLESKDLDMTQDITIKVGV